MSSNIWHMVSVDTSPIAAITLNATPCGLTAGPKDLINKSLKFPIIHGVDFYMPKVTALKNTDNFSVFSIETSHNHANEDVTMRDVYLDASVVQRLSHEALSHRLWSTHRALNKQLFQQRPFIQGGSTASTTLVLNDTITTATLSDTVVFIAAWNKTNQFIGVMQLSRIHKLSSNAEQSRLWEAGVKHTISLSEALKLFQNDSLAQKYNDSIIYCEKPDGVKVLIPSKTSALIGCSIPRAIGDYEFKPAIIADANIDITTMPHLLKHFNVDAVGTLLLITTSDGFTDAAGYNDQSPESYLSHLLKNTSPKKSDERKIAKYLAESASLKSQDDITVMIQSLVKQGKRTNFNGLLGIYDGHGGRDVAEYVAETIPVVFKQFLALSEADYAEHEDSTVQNEAVFFRDNPDNQYFFEHGEPKKHHAQISRQLISSIKWTMLLMVGIGITSKLILALTQQLFKLSFNDDNPNDDSTLNIFTKASCLFFNTHCKPMLDTEPLDKMHGLNR